MIQKRKVIGTHAFFFTSGVAFTVPGAGTAGRAAKPGPTDPVWIDLGICDWDIENVSTTEDLMAPSPGARQLYEEVVTSKGTTYKGTLKQLSNLVFQLLFSTAALPVSPTAGGQYNPDEGSPLVEGWLKLQQYGQDDALLNTLDVFVSMKLGGGLSFGDKAVDVSVIARKLFSTLNTGTLT